jgi:hypothetical protein
LHELSPLERSHIRSVEVELLSDDVAEKLNRLDRDTEVERLLTDLKTRRGLPA